MQGRSTRQHEEAGFRDFSGIYVGALGLGAQGLASLSRLACVGFEVSMSLRLSGSGFFPVQMLEQKQSAADCHMYYTTRPKTPFYVLIPTSTIGCGV